LEKKVAEAGGGIIFAALRDGEREGRGGKKRGARVAEWGGEGEAGPGIVKVFWKKVWGWG